MTPILSFQPTQGTSSYNLLKILNGPSLLEFHVLKLLIILNQSLLELCLILISVLVVLSVYVKIVLGLSITSGRIGLVVN